MIFPLICSLYTYTSISAGYGQRSQNGGHNSVMKTPPVFFYEHHLCFDCTVTILIFFLPYPVNILHIYKVFLKTNYLTGAFKMLCFCFLNSDQLRCLLHTLTCYLLILEQKSILAQIFILCSLIPIICELLSTDNHMWEALYNRNFASWFAQP